MSNCFEEMTPGFPARTAMEVGVSTSIMLYFFHFHFEWFAAALLAFYLLLWWKKLSQSSIWEEVAEEGKRIFDDRVKVEEGEDENEGYLFGRLRSRLRRITGGNNNSNDGGDAEGDEGEEGEEEEIEIIEEELVAACIEDLQAALPSPTASPTSLTYRAPDGQELSNDETMKEILDKFEGVEIDFEDEKYLITGPTEMVHQVYEEMIEAFGEAEGEEEENKEEEEKKEDEDEDAEEKEEENEAKEDDEEEDDEEKDTEEGEDGETEEVKEKKVKPKVAAPLYDDEEEEKKDEEKRGKTDKKKMKRESDKSEDDVDDDIEDDIVIIEAEEVEGACKSKGQDDGDESQDKDETTEFSLDRLSLGRFTERINEFENNKLDEICEETSTEVKIEKGIFAIEEEEDEEEEEEGAEEQKGDDKKKEKRELQEKKKDKIQFTINGGTEEDRNSAEDLLSTHLSSVSDSRDEISQVLRREFGPKKAESWKQKVKNVANDDQIICQGICRDSVHLLHSSKAKSVTICQASFASFSVESAPYFRCDVTAVTPPKNWTDDVITFFFKFASEENREILANLRQEMQYFYGNEENENKWQHVEDPREGDIIAVPGNMDDYWYRAVIVSKEEGEEDGGEEAEQEGDEEEKKGEKETNGAEDEMKGEKENEKKKEEDEEERAEEAFFWVRLLDYGAFAKVPQSNVMVLRKAKDFDFVTKVPFQAIFASFPRELVVKRAPEGEEEEEEKEEEKQNEKGKGEEKGDSPEKKEKQKEEKKGDEGKSEESRDDGKRRGGRRRRSGAKRG